MPQTPNAPHVMARERTPPMFRPSNQANMEPAAPLNPSATQSFMPGLGVVRRGNAITTLGLDPAEDRAFRFQVRQQAAAEQLAARRAEVAKLQQELLSLEAMQDRAQGRTMPADKAQAVRRAISRIKARLAIARQAPGVAAAPWERMPVVMAPATPSPNMGVPAGISTQSPATIARIKAMQAGYQPVRPIDGFSIDQDKVLPMAAAAAGGLLLIGIFLGSR